MEKEWKRMNFGGTPLLISLLSLLLLCLHVDFFWGDKSHFHQWRQYFSCSETSFWSGKCINTTLEEQEFINIHLQRLVRGDDRRDLDATGFACDKTVDSVVCVSNKAVRIDTTNMTVYIPSDDDDSQQDTVVHPYARRGDHLDFITPVSIRNSTAPPPCQYNHPVPAAIFSTGSTGNTFHEMNELIIPLFITTRQFRSRVLLIIENYEPSFESKYGTILSHLSAYDVMNPAQNGSVHCFPGSIVGLKYHDYLSLNSSDIPGGYGMPEFRRFLRQVYGLKFSHVSQIGTKPRLMLISRTTTRRFLNEEEMISLIQEVGFQVIVVKGSKVASNLNKFAKLINTCSVLVGAHGAGLTNQVFLPSGAVMIQLELLGIEWASTTYFGNTAGAMEVHYLRYKIEAEESSLLKVYGRDNSVVSDPGSVYQKGGYSAARRVYLDQQSVRVNLVRFRETLVEAYSMVTDLEDDQ